MEEIIEIKVNPNSKEQKIQKLGNNFFEIWIKSKAEKGKANIELLKCLSDYFKVHQNQIRIIKGLKKRNKVIKIIY